MNKNKMRKKILYVTLCLLMPFALFSQKNDSILTVDFGFGTGYSHTLSGALNVGITSSINSNLANFIDYNMFVNKGGSYLHEVNIKFGPYSKFGKNSYFSFSTGLSLIFNLSEPLIKTSPITRYEEENYLFNIPIQLKLNTHIYDRLGLGLKFTYNKVLKDNVDDKQTVIIFLSYRFG